MFCFIGYHLYLWCTKMFVFSFFFSFFVPVVLFFSLNIIGAAAAQFPPRASIHFYKISCCVWIFDSKPNTEQQQPEERKPRGGRGAFFALDSAASSAIKTLDPREPKKNLPRWSRHISSAGCQQIYFSRSRRRQRFWRKGGAGIRSRRFRQLIGHFYIISLGEH